MPNSCPVKNEEYKELEKSLGEIATLSVWHMNGDKIPTLDQANKLLQSKVLNILHHAETPFDLQDKMSGPIGEGLSKEGVAESEKNALTPEIQRLKTIICSDAPRSVQTCEIYKKYNPELNIIPNSNLRTWNRGTAIGKNEDAFDTKYYLEHPNETPKEGESFNSWFNTFIPEIQKFRNIGKDSGILFHGDGIKALTSLQENYGTFSSEIYLHEKTEDAALKPFQTIRQFNLEQQELLPSEKVARNNPYSSGQLEMANAGEGLEEFRKRIADLKNSDSPLGKLVKILSVNGLLKDIQGFRSYDDIKKYTDGKIESSGGVYNPQDKTITMHLNKDEEQKNKSHILVHEIMHLVSDNFMNAYLKLFPEKAEGLDTKTLETNITLNSRQIKVMHNIYKIYEKAKQTAQEEGWGNKYGFDNAKEFISEAFSNGSFINRLKNIPSIFQRIVNLFKDFLSSVLELLNAKQPSILDDLYESFGSIIKEEQEKQLATLEPKVPFEKALESLKKGKTFNGLRPARNDTSGRVFATKTGEDVKRFADSINKWATQTVPKYSNILAIPHQDLGTITFTQRHSVNITSTTQSNQYVNPIQDSNQSFGAGTWQPSNLTAFTSEPVRTPAETVYDKLIKSQSELDLDESTDAKTGQRRHIYTITKNGVKRDLGPSVTTRIDKKFNPKEEDKDFNLSIADRGTQVHKDLENEFKRYLNANHEISPIAKDNLEKNTPEHIFSQLRSFANQVIDFYRQKNIAGLKILPECKVVNELSDAGKGMPGTIDLLVLYPDNSYDKYDWKGKYNLSAKGRIDQVTKGYFREQSNSLSDILKSSYGLSDRRVDVMLPMNLLGKRNYNADGKGDALTLENIEISPFSFGAIDPQKMYLQPVVIHYAESDDQDIQTYRNDIDKVIKQTLQAKSKGDDADIQIATINASRLEQALFDVTFRKDVSSMTNIILKELETIRNVIKNKDKSVDLTKSLERLKIYQTSSGFIEQRIKDGENQLKDLDKMLVDPNLTEEDRQFLKEDKQITQDRLYHFDKAHRLVTTVMKEIIQYSTQVAQELADKAGFNVDVSKPEVELAFGDRNLTLSSQVDKVNLMTALQLIHESEAKSELKREEYTKPIIVDAETLKKKYKDKIFDIYTSKLIAKNSQGIYKWRHTINSDFFKERDVNAIVAAGTNLPEGKQWFIDNTIFNRDRFNKDLQNLEEKFNKLISLGDNTESEKQQAIEEFKQQFDTNDDFSNVGALLHGQRGNKYLIPKEKWFSEDYREIEKNPDLLKLYRDCLKLNFIAVENGLLKEWEAYTHFPFIETNFSQAWQQGSKEGLNKFVGRMADAITITDAEKESKGDLDPLSGNPNLEVSVMGLGIMGNQERQSVDIGLCYEIFASALAKYEELTKVIPDVNLLLLAEKNKKMFPRLKRGKVSDTAVENTTNAKFMQDIIDYSLYGKTQGNDSTIKVWNNFISRALQLADKNLSGDKLLNEIASFTVVRGLALSIKSTLSNLFGGLSNFYMQQYGEKLGSRAISEVIKNSEKKKMLSEYFQPHTEDSRDRELQKKAAGKKLVPSFSRTLLFGMHFTDEGIQELCNIAEAMGSMLDDNGKRVNIKQHLLRTRKDISAKNIDSEVEKISKTQSLWATVKFDENKHPYWEYKDGKKVDMTTPINGLQSNRTLQQRQVKDMSNRIIGAKNSDDPMGANTNNKTRLLFTYRGWIPGQLNARLKKMRFIPAQNTFIEGRWRLLGQLFTHTRSSATILFGMLGGDRFAPNVKDAADDSYQKKKQDYEKNNPGKTFDMDKDEYFHQYVNTIQSYAKELMLTVGIFILALLIKPDKDADEDEKARRAYMAKYFKSFFNELSFYYDPREFVQMFSNSVPAIGTLTDLMKLISDLEQEIQGEITGDDATIQKAMPLKQTLKFLPGTRQIEDIMALLNADFRKDWNIKYQNVQYF